MMEEDGNEGWLAEKERREAEAMAKEAKRLRKNKLLAKMGRPPVPKEATNFEEVYGGMDEMAAAEEPR